MSKDRFKDLRSATLWPAVSYEELPLQPLEQEDHLSTLDARQQYSAISADKESKITQFLHETLSIGSIIERIDELAQQVQKIHFAMLQPTATPELAEQLKEKTEEIKQLSYETSAKLKELEQAQTHCKDNDVTSAQQRIRESHIFVLTRKLRDTMIEYSKEIVRHRERCKNIIARELAIAGNYRSYDDLNEMIDNGFPGTFSSSIMIDKQITQQILDEVEARHQDITKLETSIKELHDMFLDLAILVTEQGELVNSIEHHVLRSVDFVEVGAGYVCVAEQYQKKALTTKMVILVILVILCVSATLMVPFILLMYFTHKKLAFG